MNQNSIKKIEKVLYFLIFITSSLLAITAIYIEIRILMEMSHFGEPLYQLPSYNLRLKGNPATMAHLVNIILVILALVVVRVSYKNLRK